MEAANDRYRTLRISDLSEKELLQLIATEQMPVSRYWEIMREREARKPRLVVSNPSPSSP